MHENSKHEDICVFSFKQQIHRFKLLERKYTIRISFWFRKRYFPYFKTIKF